MMDIKSKFLDEILNCPSVEWLTVDDIFYLKNGYTPSKSKVEYWSNGDIPWFRMEDLRLNGGILDTAIQHVHESGIKGELFPANSIIMATTATIGIHALVTKDYLSNQQFTNFTIKEKYKLLLNIKFVYYYFFVLDEKAKKSVNTSSFASVQMNEVRKWDFPIPPLPIQQKIVDILDKFTELTAELTAGLTAELTARKQQYEYYREQLISNSGGTLVSVEDIAEIYLGLTYTPTYVEKGIKFISAQNTSKDFLDLSNTKYISEEEFNRSTSNAKPRRGDVLFTRVGSNLGHPVIVETDEKLCIFVSLGFLRMKNENALNTYIKHWMNTNLFWEQVWKNVHGAAKVNLNTGWLKNFQLRLPSLDEQARIVEILDKFDALTNSITEGLPREIELRQQQYEYYRDLLLSFLKPDGVK